MRKLYLLLFVALFSMASFAQEGGQVKGKIVDAETGETLPGVAVALKGTSQGVSTDVNGAFTLTEVPAGNQILVFSFIGYKTYELPLVANGKSQIVGTLELNPESIGLEEVEVLADIVDVKRQPPTPISTISALEIEEKMGAQEFPELLKSTPGVFVNTVGGSFGAANVRIRGFGSENTAVLINGIPVNDMENGRVFWSNWGGLNDVTRNQQVQRGLGVSKLAVSALGGTINIITKPTDHRKGLRVSYSQANRSWQNRVMLTASTGLMKGEWAVTVSGSTRQGEGFREGTSANSWAYFLSAYKRLGKKHQLVLTAFGAPQTTDRGSNGTQTAFDVVGKKNWNPAWGYRDGKKLNARRNTFHKPMFMLNHYWDLKENMTLTTSAYYSFGRGGGTNVVRTGEANISQPINRFNIVPGDNPDEFQIPWDDMVAENQANFVSLSRIDENGVLSSVEGRESNYIILESRNDHNWVGALSTLNWDINEDFSITAGLDYRWYRGFHYQQVDDLLGGDFWIDRERFNNQPHNNLLEPRNTPKREGDRIGYDYNGTVVWGGAFLQGEYTLNNFDFFATGTFVRTGFQRNGRFLHEEFSETSLGKSPWYTFNNFTGKAGLNYRITGRHNVFVNGGFFTRAPFFRDAFVDNRTSNDVVGNLENQEIYSLEGGYGYRSARFAANLNVYRTSWQNRAYSQGVLSEAFGGEFVNYRMLNVGAIHQGVELDFTLQATSALQITGMLSLGDFRWDGNAEAIVTADPSLIVLNNPLTGRPTTEDPLVVFTDDKKVGGTAQTVSALGFRYRSPKFWYVGASANYYDYLYEDFNPEILSNLPPGVNNFSEEELTQYTDALNQVQKLPNAFTFDIYGGKSWKVNRNFFLQLKANINNITNNQFIIDSQQRVPGLENFDPVTGESTLSPFVQYYFGRTYFLSVVLSFR